jgi:hypothetical protein
MGMAIANRAIRKRDIDASFAFRDSRTHSRGSSEREAFRIRGDPCQITVNNVLGFGLEMADFRGF